MKKFQAHRALPKTDQDLMALKMKPGDSITEFIKKFWTSYGQIEDSKEDVALYAFKDGLLPDTDLRKDIWRNGAQGSEEFSNQAFKANKSRNTIAKGIHLY